jgi:RNA polymerase sigma-70 factor, ECF subfamily
MVSSLRRRILCPILSPSGVYPVKVRRCTINSPKEPEDPSMFTDARLLIRLQAGEQDSFEVLFTRHYDRVYGILYRLIGNRADAEDVAQQVFLQLYRSPHRIRLRGDDTNVGGWLYRVAVNRGYNALRSRRRQDSWLSRLQRLWSYHDQAFDPDEALDTASRQAQVRQILAEMKPRDAQLLVLRHSGLSYKELAAALNIAPGSVGSLLTRAERAFAVKYRLAFPEEE